MTRSSRDSRTEGFNELREEVIKYDPIITSEITGVEPELVYEAARTYATNRPSAIFYAMGITHHIHGTENVMNVSNLALITGNLGKYGSGIFPLRGQNNVQGSSDMGALAEFYPGYIRWDSDKIEKFAKLWNSTLPKKKGLTLSEMFDKAADGEIKAIYLMGENPLITEANIARVEEGIDNLEFFIVQDILMSEQPLKQILYFRRRLHLKRRVHSPILRGVFRGYSPFISLQGKLSLTGG